MPRDQVLTLHFEELPDGNLKVTGVTAEERSFRARRLHPTLCLCGEHSEFHSYPGRGECSCGLLDEHVHCSVCGGVTQVG